MKKEELIKQIQESIPDGAEVVILDHRKNLNRDFGDGSAEGVYQDFNVAMMEEGDIADGVTPFGVLEFDNDDYNRNGSVNEENFEL